MKSRFDRAPLPHLFLANPAHSAGFSFVAPRARHQIQSTSHKADAVGTAKVTANRNAAQSVGRGGGAYTPRTLFFGFAMGLLTIP
jgi:hypothetical protein